MRKSRHHHPTSAASDRSGATAGRAAGASTRATARASDARCTRDAPYPGQQPVMLPPAPAKTVMSKRWAIGVDVGPESYVPDVDGSEPTEFGQFELAARYRIRKPIELGLALHIGGADKISEGGIYFDFRYRFLAEQTFNVYALASLGILAVAHEDASHEDEKRRAVRCGSAAVSSTAGTGSRSPPSCA